MRTPATALSVLISATVSPILAAHSIEIDSFNNSPLVASQGGLYNTNLVSRGLVSAAITTELASNSTDNQNLNEQLLFDGESYTTTAIITVGVSERLSIDARLPYIQHEGGQLDGLISDWHDLWGLPDGNRAARPEDVLQYSYTSSTGESVSLLTDDGGMGDVSIGAAWQLSSNFEVQSRVWFPTGDAQRLTGNDGGKLYLGARHASYLQNNNKVSYSASAGVLWTSESELLANTVEDAVFLGRGAVRWQIMPSVAFKAQIDLHSAYYQSDFEEIGDFAHQLGLAASFSLTKNLELDVFFTEDTAVNSASDIVFGASLRLY